MSFASPAWLLLAAVLPLLWWLHRRITAPRDVVVASVDALRGAAVEAPAARPRRRSDPELVAWLLGAACLTLAAAGPRIGAPEPSVLLVVDNSASSDRRGEGGATLRSSAIRGAREAIEAVHPGAVADVLALGSDRRPVRVLVRDLGEPTSSVPAPPSNLGADGLPGSLAAALRVAREERYPGLVLVTDRDVPATPGVVVAGPGVTPVPDAGIVAVVLDDGDAVVSVLRHAGGPERLEAAIPGGEGGVVAIPRRAEGESAVIDVRVPAPQRGGQARYIVRHAEGASDGYAANDAVVVERRGGIVAVRLGGPGARGAARLRALLETLGIAIETSAVAEVDVSIVVGGPPMPPDGSGPPILHLAVAPGRSAGITVSDATGVIKGARVAAFGVLGDALPDPGARLLATGRIDSGGATRTGAWSDVRGALAVALDRRVLVAFDPEDERSTWAGDASFPVLVASALQHLAGGPDRLDTHVGLPPGEARPASSVPPHPDASEVAAVVRQADDDPSELGAGAALATAGALLFLIAGALSVVRGRRFSGLAAGARTAG